MNPPAPTISPTDVGVYHENGFLVAENSLFRDRLCIRIRHRPTMLSFRRKYAVSSNSS